MNTENKLPEDFKKRWCEALRSGEYKQGRQELWNPTKDTYCCLGVAAVVCGVSRDQLVGFAYVSRTHSAMRASRYASAIDSIPVLLRRDPEDSNNGDINVAIRLANMNDSQNKTFEEIADFIEQNL